MKDNNNNYNKDYYNYTNSGSENKYPDYSSNPPLPASYIQNDNNNNNKIHPLDDLDKFNSKPVSQSYNVNLENPYQSGNFSNNNNDNNNNNNNKNNNNNSNIPYQAGNFSNSNNNNNNNIPYQAGNMQYQFQTPNQFPQQQIPIPQQQIPIPQQQIPIQPQQIPIPQQQIPIQPQPIPIQPQVTYINPQPVVMSQPAYISVPNVQFGGCPYCGGSGISFQTGLRCHCVGGMSQGDMFALGIGLGMMGPRYGYRHRPFFYP